jgi:hypothetical protein
MFKIRGYLDGIEVLKEAIRHLVPWAQKNTT